jgi:nucleoside 2-deoxyribosyltransferase
MNTKKLKIYLAGPFLPYQSYKDWRDYVKERAPGHLYYDPRIDTEQYTSLTFTRDDLLKGVESSDLVFGYNPKGNYQIDPYGLCIELGVAFGKRIPIILCDENEWIFPMLPPLAKRLFTVLELSVEYLNNLDDINDEFQSFYKTIAPKMPNNG